MSEATHELKKNEETGEVEKVSVKGNAKSKMKKAWFPDEKGGHRGQPLEYDDQKFFLGTVEKSALRKFVRVVQQEIPRRQKQLAKAQQDEIKALQGDEDGENTIELSQDRLDYYESEGEKLSDMLMQAYDELLTSSVVGWDLPRPFSVELLKSFDISDKAELCQLIGARGLTGFSATKN